MIIEVVSTYKKNSTFIHTPKNSLDHRNVRSSTTLDKCNESFAVFPNTCCNCDEKRTPCTFRPHTVEIYCWYFCRRSLRLLPSQTGNELYYGVFYQSSAYYFLLNGCLFCWSAQTRFSFSLWILENFALSFEFD